jgi:DNA primase
MQEGPSTNDELKEDGLAAKDEKHFNIHYPVLQIPD